MDCYFTATIQSQVAKCAAVVSVWSLKKPCGGTFPRLTPEIERP